MKKIILTIFSMTLLISHAKAFECREKGLTLNFSSQREMITIKHESGQVIEVPVKKSYDGQSNYSLITGEGIAVTYSNHYGCIRMVELTSAIRLSQAPYRIGRVNFGNCYGGSTPDRLCHP